MAAVLALALAAPASSADEPAFEEINAEAGLDFVYRSGRDGGYYVPELFGGGAALFDYDGDGDLDLYLVQGGTISREGVSGAGGDRLLRNDLVRDAAGRVTARLVDVTGRSGLDGLGTGSYGMGVAAGDCDNDGRVDLYVTAYGRNRLLRNLGGGAFADVTDAAGAGETRWSVPAVFADFDGDGWLDLFVGNYLDYRAATDQPCFTEAGLRDYCQPLVYPPVPDRLLRNRGTESTGAGNGAGDAAGGSAVAFEDVSARAGLRQAYGRALGAIAADFDSDGRLDLYVANDLSENQLWMNRASAEQGLRFVDEALLAGASLNRDGEAEGSMGVDARDYDGDGDEDLFMTHSAQESNTLYRNEGGGLFRDVTVESGLAGPSLPYTAFGTAWLDVDNDGVLELAAVNGAVRAIEALVRARDPFPYHERNQLFRQVESAGTDAAGDGKDAGPRYVEAGALAGALGDHSEVSRAAVFGDLEGDGDTDLLVTNIDAPARLLRNRLGQDRPWIGLRLQHGARDALGAWVGVKTTGGAGARRWRRVRTDGSYASSNDPRLLFGLGADPPGAAGVDVETRWPDGARVRYRGLPERAYAVIRRPAPASAADAR